MLRFFALAAVFFLPDSSSKNRKVYKSGRIITSQEVHTGDKMDLSSQSFGRLPEAEYIPYFYESGQFLRYNTPVKRKPAYASFVSSGYNFSSEGTSRFDPDQPQTVEQIIDQGYLTIPTGDPVTAMITDKKHTAWLGLDDAITQIRQRYEIYEQNIEMIEQNKCQSMNVFLAHYDKVKPMTVDDRIYYSLNKNIQRLYAQQMDERVTLWKDISRIRQSLPESAQLYLAAVRKTSIMNENAGDTL